MIQRGYNGYYLKFVLNNIETVSKQDKIKFFTLLLNDENFINKAEEVEIIKNITINSLKTIINYFK